MVKCHCKMSTSGKNCFKKENSLNKRDKNDKYEKGTFRNDNRKTKYVRKRRWCTRGNLICPHVLLFRTFSKNGKDGIFIKLTQERFIFSCMQAESR